MVKSTSPAGLGTEGRKVWDDITGTYRLRPDELRILEDACREIDLVDRLEAELKDTPLVVKGSMGQPVASPLVQEVRQHRQVVKTLLGSLKLPDEGDARGQGRSGQARDAAAARWKRGA